MGTLELDQAQIIRSCDQAFCTTFDCEAPDLVGTTLADLFSPQQRRAELELAARLNRANAADLLTTIRVRGQEHLVRIRIHPAGDGFHCSVEEVRGDDDLVYRLAGVEQRWKGLLVNSENGLAVLDGDGRIVEHNAAFVALMRFRDRRGVAITEDALAGARLSNLAGSTHLALPGLAAYLAAPEGTFQARTIAAGCKVEVKAQVLELPNQERIGVLIVVRDITEELRIAERDAIIQSDLARARALQRVILSDPPKIARYNIDLVYQPLDQVGGDIYDIEILPAGTVRIFIGDATGHGIAAALITMLLKSAYDAVKHTLGGPALVLEALNDRIASTYKNYDAMFTGLVLDLSTDTQDVSYANAGHPPPILVDRDGVRELEFGGTVLGVQAYKTYPSWTLKLHPESAIYLVTDGVAEARRDNGEFFGDDRLMNLVKDANQLRERPGEAMLAGLDAWLRPARPKDDITVIAVRPFAT